MDEHNGQMQPLSAALSAIERIAQSRGLTTNGAKPTRQQPQSSTDSSPCPVCAGTGFVIPDLQPGAPGYGKPVRCSRCDTGLSAKCGLNEQEQQLTAAAIKTFKGQEDITAALRYLVDYITDHPQGWLTLWGSYGTAKTLTVQAIVAQLLKRRTLARFYHARQLEQGWFDDIHGDCNHAQMYRRLPVLAIDEIDKFNLKSDWVRVAFQELLDTRYRAAIAGSQLTLLICQHDPEQVMPGDVFSRMSDGRFMRPWSGNANRYTISRYGERWLPGIVHVEGQDARRLMKPTNGNGAHD